MVVLKYSSTRVFSCLYHSILVLLTYPAITYRECYTVSVMDRIIK